MAELKPCPFCGSDDVGTGFKYPEYGETLKHFVVCNKCGSKTADYRKKQTAIHAWERRAEDGKTENR